MYAILNRLDTTAARVIAKAMLLTAIIAIVFVFTYYAATIAIPVIVAAIATAAAFVAHVVAVTVAAVVHAATFAAWCLVRAALFVALCWLWQRMPAINWRMVVTFGKGLALTCVCVGCFVGAIFVVAIAAKFLVAGGVMVAGLATVRVM